MRLPFFSQHSEPKVWKVMKKIKGINFIDVGANRGLVYTFPLCHNFLRVYAIEPNPRLAQWMSNEVKRRHIANIEVNQWAASNINGKVGFFLDSTIPSGSSSLDYRMVKTDSRKIDVITKRLDDWWGEAPIDLMKIDVEGEEFNVLSGAGRILGLTKNVIIEMHRAEKGTLGRILDEYKFSRRWLDDTHIYASRQREPPSVIFNT